MYSEPAPGGYGCFASPPSSPAKPTLQSLLSLICNVSGQSMYSSTHAALVPEPGEVSATSHTPDVLRRTPPLRPSRFCFRGGCRSRLRGCGLGAAASPPGCPARPVAPPPAVAQTRGGGERGPVCPGSANHLNKSILGLVAGGGGHGSGYMTSGHYVAPSRRLRHLVFSVLFGPSDRPPPPPEGGGGLQGGGGGGGTRPWWVALLACGGAYWPLTLEPSAMTSVLLRASPCLGGGGDPECNFCPWRPPLA